MEEIREVRKWWESLSQSERDELVRDLPLPAEKRFTLTYDQGKAVQEILRRHITDLYAQMENLNAIDQFTLISAEDADAANRELQKDADYVESLSALFN